MTYIPAPQSRHDAYRTPRQRPTAAALEHDIARITAELAAPDWHHGHHPERSLAWLRRQLEVARADLELARDVEAAERRILEAAE